MYLLYTAAMFGYTHTIALQHQSHTGVCVYGVGGVTESTLSGVPDCIVFLFS